MRATGDANLARPQGHAGERSCRRLIGETSAVDNLGKSPTLTWALLVQRLDQASFENDNINSSSANNADRKRESA